MKVGHDNVYNEERQRLFDPIEGMLTEISDLNEVLETITSQKLYLSLKPAEKETTAKDMTKNNVGLVKSIGSSIYKNSSDQTREVFIGRMIEGLLERVNVTLHIKDLGINPRTAMCWWNYYQETGKVAYKKAAKKSQ